MSNNKGPREGLEIYAKNIVNNGAISSDTYAKLVTDDYKGEGQVIAKSDSPQKMGKIKGIFFEVGGNMLNDGIIKTDKDAVVGVSVRGNYVSSKGKIIQGESINYAWHTTWWGIAILTILTGIIISGLVYIFGWNK